MDALISFDVWVRIQRVKQRLPVLVARRRRRRSTRSIRNTRSTRSTSITRTGNKVKMRRRMTMTRMQRKPGRYGWIWFAVNPLSLQVFGICYQPYLDHKWLGMVTKVRQVLEISNSVWVCLSSVSLDLEDTLNFQKYLLKLAVLHCLL